MFITKDLIVELTNTRILDGVDFIAKPGEITAIIGPNGSGKTTLLRAMAGDLPFTGGISLNGRDVTRMRHRELAKYRGVLSQHTELSFPFQVREVVSMGIEAFGEAHKHAAEEMLTQSLSAVGLAGFEARHYHELSGGQRQRVQLARVLCQIWHPLNDKDEPCWLLLDEPVSSLDIAHQIVVMQLAQTFAQRGGGVIAVMHDLNLTSMFAHSVILLTKGHVVHQGPVDEVIIDGHLRSTYGVDLSTNRTPKNDGTFVLPQSVSQHAEIG